MEVVDARQIGRVLVFARDLIKTKNSWATEWMAFNSEGLGCPPESQTACRWCGLGAIYRACSELQLKDFRTATLDELRKEARALYKTDRFERVNDYHGHAAVLRCFDTTLKRLFPTAVTAKPRLAKRPTKHLVKRKGKAG